MLRLLLFACYQSKSSFVLCLVFTFSLFLSSSLSSGFVSDAKNDKEDSPRAILANKGMTAATAAATSSNRLLQWQWQSGNEQNAETQDTFDFATGCTLMAQSLRDELNFSCTCDNHNNSTSVMSCESAVLCKNKNNNNFSPPVVDVMDYNGNPGGVGDDETKNSLLVGDECAQTLVEWHFSSPLSEKDDPEQQQQVLDSIKVCYTYVGTAADLFPSTCLTWDVPITMDSPATATSDNVITEYGSCNVQMETSPRTWESCQLCEPCVVQNQEGWNVDCTNLYRGAATGSCATDEVIEPSSSVNTTYQHQWAAIFVDPMKTNRAVHMVQRIAGIAMTSGGTANVIMGMTFSYHYYGMSLLLAVALMLV